MMESLKEELVKLIWLYGWKTFEGVLPEVRQEVEAKTKKLVEELDLGSKEDGSTSIEPVIENKIIQMEVPVVIPEVLPEATEEKPTEEKPKSNKKKDQREKERETRRKNEEAGLTVEELLSESNLRDWKTKGYSKAYISRELVGCREELVSKAYKTHGI